jgi:hypothetical protein
VTNLLQAASFKQNCPVCGGAYRVTLYDILQQHRLGEQWQSARPPHGEGSPLAAAVPAAELGALAQAWDAVAASLAAKSLDFDIALAPEIPHDHPGGAEQAQ